MRFFGDPGLVILILAFQTAPEIRRTAKSAFQL
jgi:hypothetical protein